MNTDLRASLAIAAAVVAAGCGMNFKPASYVDSLRILAVRADAPEVQEPGHLGPSSTRLTALVADPAALDDPSREVTVFYLSCTPDPLDPNGSGCSALANLKVDGSIARMAAASLCGAPSGDGGMSSPMRFAGIEACAHGRECQPITVDAGGTPMELPAPTYEIPEETDLDVLPAGHPARTRGIQAMIVAVAVSASPSELVAGVDATDPCAFAAAVGERLGTMLDTRENVTAVKRVQIRGPDAPDAPNVNPAIEGVSSDGAPIPEEIGDPVPTSARIVAGAVADLRPVATEVHQRYTRLDASGAKVEEVEELWTYSWFTSAGTLKHLRTRGTEEAAEFTAPTDKKDDPIPVSKRIFVWAVVRDGRGGVDWVTRELRLSE